MALQVSFDQIAQAQGSPTEAAANQTLTNAQTALLTTKQMAQNFGVDPTGHLEGTVEKLMEDPITYVQGLLRGLGPAELNGKGKGLCAQLSPVLGQFPFNSAAKAEATAADVSAAFKPKEGAIWSFFDQNLAKYLIPQGSRFVPDPELGGSHQCRIHQFLEPRQSVHRYGLSSGISRSSFFLHFETHPFRRHPERQAHHRRTGCGILGGYRGEELYLAACGRARRAGHDEIQEWRYFSTQL